MRGIAPNGSTTSLAAVIETLRRQGADAMAVAEPTGGFNKSFHATATLDAFAALGAPGGPLAVYTLNPTIQAQDIERIKIIFGLDQPVHIQYVKWASGISMPVSPLASAPPIRSQPKGQRCASNAAMRSSKPATGAPQ